VTDIVIKLAERVTFEFVALISSLLASIVLLVLGALRVDYTIKVQASPFTILIEVDETDHE